MPDPILTALEQQVGCYRRLARLAEQQHLFVQNSQTDQLLETLQKRQVVLDQITDLEKTIGPVKPRWSQYLSTLAGDVRRSAEVFMAETKTLLEQITSADRNDTIVLQQRKLNLGRQINKTVAARTVNKNYAAAAYGPRKSTLDMQQ